MQRNTARRANCNNRRKSHRTHKRAALAGAVVVRGQKKAGPHKEVRPFLCNPAATELRDSASRKQQLANEDDLLEAVATLGRSFGSRRGFRSSRGFRSGRGFRRGAGAFLVLAIRTALVRSGARRGDVLTTASRSDVSTVATTEATVVAMSAATMAAMMPTIATAAKNAPVTTMMTTTTMASAAAITTIAGNARATMATMTRSSLLLTTQQGDADDREKHRDPKQQRTIHLSLLYKTDLRVSRNTKLHCCRRLYSSPGRLRRAPSTNPSRLLGFSATRPIGPESRLAIETTIFWESLSIA